MVTPERLMNYDPGYNAMHCLHGYDTQWISQEHPQTETQKRIETKNMYLLE